MQHACARHAAVQNVVHTGEHNTNMQGKQKTLPSMLAQYMQVSGQMTLMHLAIERPRFACFKTQRQMTEQPAAELCQCIC